MSEQYIKAITPQLELEEIVWEIVAQAMKLWEESPYDFCIQSVSPDSIVFGSVNRVVWTIHGFSCEESYCTERFIAHFKEIEGGDRSGSDKG